MCTHTSPYKTGINQYRDSVLCTSRRNARERYCVCVCKQQVANQKLSDCYKYSAFDSLLYHLVLIQSIAQNNVFYLPRVFITWPPVCSTMRSCIPHWMPWSVGIATVSFFYHQLKIFVINFSFPVRIVQNVVWIRFDIRFCPTSRKISAVLMKWRKMPLKCMKMQQL